MPARGDVCGLGLVVIRAAYGVVDTHVFDRPWLSEIGGGAHMEIHGRQAGKIKKSISVAGFNHRYMKLYQRFVQAGLSSHRVFAIVDGLPAAGGERRVGGDAMSSDRLAVWGRLLDQSSGFGERAQAAASAAAAAARGGDSTGSVTVMLNGDGRVSAVQIAARWRDRLATRSLGEAVREAVQTAALARLAAWGQVFGDETPAAATVRGALDRDGLAEQLQQLSTGRMSSEDGQAALRELLAMAEDLERGIDDVSARLRSAATATHTGHSANRHVTVTILGSGEVSGIRFHQGWLANAHEINIGRQALSAFQAAYESAARDGVDRLIADSALGEVQRATQDPFGLARRLRLHD